LKAGTQLIVGVDEEGLDLVGALGAGAAQAYCGPVVAHALRSMGKAPTAWAR
jgi:hypothetical protein